MKSLKELIDHFKRGPSDLVGIETRNDGTRVVRMRKNDEELSVISADTLPPVNIPEESEAVSPAPLDLPGKLKAKYASIAISSKNATVKLLSFPGRFDAEAEAKVVDSLGLEKPDDFRIGYKLISEGKGKSESKVLAVAVPEIQAQSAVMLLSHGRPAPFSLEISGLAAMTAFSRSPKIHKENESVGAIYFEESTTTFVIFHKRLPALVRTFDIGTNTILDKVQETLGVDKDTAQGIIADGAFDISQAVSKIMGPLVKQLIVSRDFVERRENCHVAKIYASGGLIVSRDSLNEMQQSLGIDIDFWNPFDGLNMAPNAYPESLSGQEWQFSAAVGACLATFEES
ncbi:hypothetical protein ACFLS1_00470 [Verrucomicrobiota bacterium]